MKRQRELTIAVTALTLLIFLVTGCAENRPITTKTPDEARLRARVSEFHRALGSNDIVAWYGMTSPIIRERMTFEQFKTDLRWDENAARRISTPMHAGLEKVCSCVEMRFLRCVIVADVSITKPGQQTVKEKPLETWEFVNGEWYWGYMGPDTKGRCPGER